MFEENLTALAEWRSLFDAKALATFLALPTEAERLALLDTIYYRELDQFAPVPLWPAGQTPGYQPAWGQREPSLRFFPCSGAKGCVLVVPGGGYNTKAIDPEGLPIVRRLLEAGYAAALLDYRVRPYTQDLSLCDMQRAIRLLRFRAGEWGFDPHRIAVAGSSAGGHLATMAAVHWDDGRPGDAIDRVGCRPDAGIISYGVFSMVGYPRAEGLCKTTPEDARTLEGLVSPYGLDVEERRRRVFFSPEFHVTPDTPPMYFWQTCDEDDPRQLFRFATALAENGVRFEAHIFPYGAHGKGLWDGSSAQVPNDPHNAKWFPLAIEWLDREWTRER